MDDNECNNQLRATLHDVFGLEDSDNLHGNEDSYGGYAEDLDRYLDTDDEDLQNLADEEKNRNQSKRVDCKARVNYRVMNDGSCIVTKIILEHNHELEPALSYFFPCHKKLRRNVKRSLVAHDIAGLRPSKSIRFLEVEAGGLKRMRTWLMAMGEIPSTAILIDQCESIKAAIGEVLPNTIHRYILRRWRRDIVRPHLSKFFPGGYPTMTDEYPVYNGIKKWLDRNGVSEEVGGGWEDLVGGIKIFSNIFPMILIMASCLRSKLSMHRVKPTKESSDDVQRDTKQVFKAMAELDEQMRRSQDRLEFMIIRINATEERFEVIRKEIFDQYRKDQANFLQLKQHRHILCS
ncbi:hypothetical protein FXO38_30697 [Capsicum annuum]|nr:hypothetical protein FXO38_30697 [Capsicum annuum]KAF3626243.1 hypothetical protein FXO37_30444 [Capsicum annuum]